MNIQARKQAVRRKSSHLVKRGLLKKPDGCSECGENPKPYLKVNGAKHSLLEMHHPDPFDPTTVIWLCAKCHHKHHGSKMLNNCYSYPQGVVIAKEV